MHPLKDSCNQVPTHMVIFDLSDASLDAPPVNGYDWFTKPKPALLEYPLVPDFFLQPSTTSPLPQQQTSSRSVLNENQGSILEPPATPKKKLPVRYEKVLKFVDISRVEVEFCLPQEDSRYHDDLVKEPCSPHSKNVNAKSSGKRAYSASLASGDTLDEAIKEDGCVNSSSRNSRRKRSRTSVPPSTLPNSAASSVALSHNDPLSVVGFQPAHRKKRPRLCHPAHGTPANTVPRLGCPHCPYVQKSGRLPDLRRHIRAHERQTQEPEWVCCGVPVELAKDYKVPPGVPVKIWERREMIGGCYHAFSRRDAYKRHLAKSVKCVGDIPKYVNGFC